MRKYLNDFIGLFFGEKEYSNAELFLAYGSMLIIGVLFVTFDTFFN